MRASAPPPAMPPCILLFYTFGVAFNLFLVHHYSQEWFYYLYSLSGEQLRLQA